MRLGSLLFFILSVQVYATDVLWLRLTPLFSYQDLTLACSNFVHSSFSPADLFFVAEVDGMTVNRAALRDRTTGDFPEVITFLPSELEGIELFRDKKERLWLKSLPQSARLLNWVFFRTTGIIEECKPPQALKTLGPSPFTFTFSSSELGGESSAIDSQGGSFNGKRQDGYAYQVFLKFTQRQLGEP